MNATTKKSGMGVDDFLTSGGDRSKFGSYLTNWKDEDGGSIKVWLHRECWAAKNWNHPVPRVISFKDRDTREDVLVVRTSRFVCHESEQLLMQRDRRDRRGNRTQPPVVCPQCILTEVAMELVDSKKLSWTDPVFTWEGDDADEASEILAGGIYNAFSSRDVERDREALKELKDARVNRRDAWKQSMLARMQWQFLVLDDANQDDGLQITFESKTLGDKMKSAINDEIRRYKSDPKRGNPAANPYPFEWSYDSTKDFADKYGVLALTNEAPTDKILELIAGEVPEDWDRALEPSSCWELKANLEAHVVKGIDLPWDRIFGPAEKAGLMVEPEDSKSDAGGDGAPEVGAGKAQSSRVQQGGPPVLHVGPEHDVWFENPKVDPAVKGKRIHLEAPEDPDPTPDELADVRKTLNAWGALEIGDVVQCDHCGGQTTTFDEECSHCGAQYDANQVLAARPCLAKCGGVVPTSGLGPKFICEKCGVVHTLAPETPDVFGAACWTREPAAAKEEPKAAAGRRRRLDASPPAEEPKSEPVAPAARQRSGVPFDKGGK